jgi:hypothetical protein
MTMSVREVAERFAGTYMQTDPDPNFADLFASEFTHWHNYDVRADTFPGEFMASAMVRTLSLTNELMPDHKDELLYLHVADSAFTLAARATGTLPDGTKIDIPRALVGTVEDGKITKIDSWGDHAQRYPIGVALRETYGLITCVACGRPECDSGQWREEGVAAANGGGE